MRYFSFAVVVAGLVWVFPTLGFAQGHIAGKVIDEDTEEAIVGASVYLEGTGYGAFTDGSGRYVLSDVPVGTYALRVSIVGYTRETRRIIVQEGDPIRIDVELRVAPILGEEIVVTATRTPAIIKNVPIRTEIITSERIREKAATTVYEALDAEPGVRVEQQCSNCNFSILRVEGLEGGYTQTLIDEQPTFGGLAGVYGLQQIQTGNIERIEVVKGSGSALYGSDALGGVVNIITKEPRALPTLNAGVTMEIPPATHARHEGQIYHRGLHRTGRS